MLIGECEKNKQGGFTNILPLISLLILQLRPYPRTFRADPELPVAALSVTTGPPGGSHW